MPNQPPDAFPPPDPKLDAIVRITDQTGLSFWQGSGVLISPDEVLTAAHVVYQSKPGDGVATNIDVVPKADVGGLAPYGHFSGTATHYSKLANDGSIMLLDSQEDFALIHLSAPVIGVTPWALGTGSFIGGGVTVSGYPARVGDGRVDVAENVTLNTVYPGLLNGKTLGPGSSGGPVWISGADGNPQVVGLVSSGLPDGTGFFTRMTEDDVAQLKAWVAEDDAKPPVMVAKISDTTTNSVVPNTFSHAYAGPVSGVQTELIDLTPDSLNISANAPSLFVHTGSGNDGIALSSGTNVADGGTGSNFLTGGSGADTFYVDACGVRSDVWDTVGGFHSGDAATMWDISPSTNTLVWTDNGGAAGYTGLTLHATAAGKPTASITLAGFSQADLSNGRLATVFGHDGVSGSDYLYVHGT